MPSDADLIVGASLTGGKEVTMHAVMRTDDGPVIYCDPKQLISTLDFGPAINVTCLKCKNKLRVELTHIEDEVA